MNFVELKKEFPRIVYVLRTVFDVGLFYTGDVIDSMLSGVQDSDGMKKELQAFLARDDDALFELAMKNEEYVATEEVEPAEIRQEFLDAFERWLC